MMKSIFDFPAIKEYLKSTKILVNSLHGGELRIMMIKLAHLHHCRFKIFSDGTVL